MKNKKGVVVATPKEWEQLTRNSKRGISMRTIEEIQDKLFMLQDKIRWAEMFIAHAKAEAHEIQESIFDKQEDDWLEIISK